MAQMTRRSLMAAGASALAFGTAHTAFAQTKTKLRFSCAFTEADMRADAYKAFGAAISRRFSAETGATSNPR